VPSCPYRENNADTGAFFFYLTTDRIQGGGTFYTHRALEIEGTVTMEVFHPNAQVFHCLYTFVAPEGTIIIRERCVYATPLQGQGRWEIVSGTGAYANLQGNGSALMPGNQENWKGFIY
jgi:hypothetical protein